MVLPDPFFESQSQKPRKHFVAPPQDRVLAVFFDLMLLAPMCSLILGSLYQSLEERSVRQAFDADFSVLLSVTVLATCTVFLVYQICFLSILGATPGMRLVKMELRSVTGARLTWTQVSLRSVLWLLEVFFLAVPFLEVLGHPRRRCFHDRAAETELVTGKSVVDHGPHPLEKRFVTNTLVAFAGALLLWVVILGWKLYVNAERGFFHHAELSEQAELCAGLTENHFHPSEKSSVDVAIAQFLGGLTDESCLRREADYALFSHDRNEQAWGYLAKSYYFKLDVTKSEAYRKQVCLAAPNSKPCQLVKSDLHKGKAQSWTEVLLQYQESFTSGDFVQAAKILQEISTLSTDFERFVQKQTIKVFWAERHTEQALGAFFAVWPFLDGQDQADVGGWLCLQQVDSDCEHQTLASCDGLQESLQRHHYTNISRDAILALVTSQECQHRHNSSLLTLSQAWSDDPQLHQLVFAISSDSPWSAAKKLATLRQLSFANGITSELQQRARLALAQVSKDTSDLKQLQNLATSRGPHDWEMEKLARSLAPKKTKVETGRLPANVGKDQK